MENTRKILTIDPGMDTGYAVTYDDPNHPGYRMIVDSGLKEFALKPTNEGKSYAACFSWLRGIHERHKITEVAFEDSTGNWINKYSQRYFYAHRALIFMVFGYYNVPITGYYPQTIKKGVLGNGRADKVDSVVYIRKKYPDIEVINDDHSDAILLLDYHLMENKPEPKPKKRRKAKKKD